MVAGAKFECVWKYTDKVKRTSSDWVFSTLRKKRVFSRNFMEKTLGLTTEQAYWYIKQLLKTGKIKKIKETEYVGNKGKHQALYKILK